MAGVMAICMEVMDRPWHWGVADCCTAACDVFARLHGVDPMARLRGRYSTRLGALRLITQGGGFERFIATECRIAGLIASSGAVGDVGVVRDGSGALALGVCTERGWVAKSERGLVAARMERAWSCRQQ
ncbi:DUF6950 family protein [Roseinatronobacter bogoriensis]|uniref:DUF6950 family protein n=1 Tax=Roseinatronobacter bogoriensis TaxID=119542 RepID=UPI001065A977|nr:hypothetical protein [Rhodobaca bogoriensis]MBB4207289.1 hypothetical protein [Rhodobaca bogoriensis DSM 18756]TDY65787.1 hypothetical protein EV660_11755 [Rhodobaca bogoriensis DSM 18756]